MLPWQLFSSRREFNDRSRDGFWILVYVLMFVYLTFWGALRANLAKRGLVLLWDSILLSLLLPNIQNNQLHLQNVHRAVCNSVRHITSCFHYLVAFEAVILISWSLIFTAMITIFWLVIWVDSKSVIQFLYVTMVPWLMSKYTIIWYHHSTMVPAQHFSVVVYFFSWGTGRTLSEFL